MYLYVGLMKGEKIIWRFAVGLGLLKSQAAKTSLSSAACIIPIAIMCPY